MDVLWPTFQQDLIQQILLSDHFLIFPPSFERRRAFWKWVIQLLEREGEEIDERIYNAYVALLSESSKILTGSTPPSPSYVTRFWGERANSNGEPNLTTVLESQTTIESGTTGLRTWNASLALADWLITHPETVQDRNLLELGSGAGFLGLVVARLQLNDYDARLKTTHPSLALSDVNSDVLQRCHQNFHLPCNNMNRHPCLQYVSLDWSDAQDQSTLENPYSTLNQTLRKADAIIGADLVYDDSIVPALTAVLNQFLRLNVEKRNKFALLALTVRRQETINTFLQCLAMNSLIYDEIDTTQRANELTFELDNHEWKLYRIHCKHVE